MFGWYVFMVDDKMCLGVKGDELLVRLPPSEHDRVAERPGVRTLDAQGKMQGYFCVEPSAYATRAQWQHWIAAALAFNPLAKATRKKAARGDGAPPRSLKESTPRASSLRKTAKTPSNTKTTPRPPARKHSVFDDDA